MRSLRRVSAVLALFLLLPASAAAVSSDLIVHNDLTIDRDKTPMTMGVPFGPGALAAVDQLRVEGPGGPVTPLQTRVMSSWWDGTPRWVLLDFPADV